MQEVSYIIVTSAYTEIGEAARSDLSVVGRRLRQTADGGAFGERAVGADVEGGETGGDVGQAGIGLRRHHDGVEFDLRFSQSVFRTVQYLGATVGDEQKHGV